MMHGEVWWRISVLIAHKSKPAAGLPADSVAHSFQLRSCDQRPQVIVEGPSVVVLDDDVAPQERDELHASLDVRWTIPGLDAG